ncbi:MAG: nucleoside triphosphate pyrophosphohydrolase [Litorimonas sp.]
MTKNDLGSDPYIRIKALMARLRSDCPWDKAQSFETIAPYTIEESYEVADAIARKDMSALKAELGDLLFQVLFHAQLASEIPDAADSFTLDDVCDSLVDKMVRRHPHVFAGADRPDWDAIKHAERTDKGQTSILADIPHALPELMRAEKLQKRAAKTGFDWPNTDGVWDKIHEEMDEVREAINAVQTSGTPEHIEAIEDEIGDLLFAVTNLARHHNVQPETALRRTNAKFTRRFEFIESHADKPVEKLTLDEMEILWLQAKAQGL